MKKRGIKLKCYKCSHQWTYKGYSKHYLTCPVCMSKIKFEKARRKHIDGMVKK